MGSATPTAPQITRPQTLQSGRRITMTEFDLGLPSYVPTASAADAASVGLEATLQAVDEQSNVISALPVHFSRRVTVADTTTLFGTDDSGAIRVVATVTTKPLALKLNLRYLADGAALPRHLLASLRFLRALRPPNRLRFTIGDRSIAEPVELPLGAEFPRTTSKLCAPWLSYSR